MVTRALKWVGSSNWIEHLRKRAKRGGCEFESRPVHYDFAKAEHSTCGSNPTMDRFPIFNVKRKHMSTVTMSGAKDYDVNKDQPDKVTCGEASGLSIGDVVVVDSTETATLLDVSNYTG